MPWISGLEIQALPSSGPRLQGHRSTAIPRPEAPSIESIRSLRLVHPSEAIKRTSTMAGANQRIYKIAGTGLGASMWFFLFYRAKKDGPVLLGWKHPWEH